MTKELMITIELQDEDGQDTQYRYIRCLPLPFDDHDTIEHVVKKFIEKIESDVRYHALSYAELTPCSRCKRWCYQHETVYIDQYSSCHPTRKMSASDGAVCTECAQTILKEVAEKNLRKHLTADQNCATLQNNGGDEHDDQDD